MRSLPPPWGWSPRGNCKRRHRKRTWGITSPDLPAVTNVPSERDFLTTEGGNLSVQSASVGHNVGGTASSRGTCVTLQVPARDVAAFAVCAEPEHMPDSTVPDPDKLWYVDPMPPLSVATVERPDAGKLKLISTLLPTLFFVNPAPFCR